MKQFKLLDGFYYRKRYIPALDYTVEEDPVRGDRYITGMLYGYQPVSIKLTPGLEKELSLHIIADAIFGKS